MTPLDLSVPLEPGEGVIVASRGGGGRSYPVWLVLMGMFVGFSFCGTGLMGVLALAVLALGPNHGDAEGAVSIVVLAATQLPCFALSLMLLGLGLAAAIVPARAPFYFLTTRRLVVRRVFGRTIALPLDAIASLTRHHAAIPLRFASRTERPTDEIVITMRAGHVPRELRVGPIAEAADLLALFEQSRAGVPLDEAPRLDASSCPAEERPLFFVVPGTRSLGMRYGPTFIGPTIVARFTEPLPLARLTRLYAGLAHAVDAEEAELLVRAAAREPGSGHVLVLDRAAARPTLDGTILTLHAGERRDPLELDPRAADRARAFLARTP
jgi:hypothetical protein